MTTDGNKNSSYLAGSTVQDLVSLAALIKKFRWLFLMICMGMLAGSFYFYHTHTYYTSSITFLVNNSNVAEVLWEHSGDGSVDVINDDRGFNRINQIIYSSQMIDFLINRFDLYKHYNIPKESDNSYLLVSTKLKKRMGVAISKTRIITVKISDRLDYNVAANMANAIGKKINDINRQITIENLTRKTEIFESLSKDLKSSSSREFAELDSLLKNMQRVLAGSAHDEAFRQLLSMNLDNLRAKSDDYFKDLFESYKYRLYSLYSLQEKNLPTISVLEKALPDQDSKSENNIFMYPLLLIFSVVIPITGFYFCMKIQSLVRIIFREVMEMKQA